MLTLSSIHHIVVQSPPGFLRIKQGVEITWFGTFCQTMIQFLPGKCTGALDIPCIICTGQLVTLY